MTNSNAIKVIGIGNAGCNIVEHLFAQSIKGVDFIVCSTNSSILEESSVPNKIHSKIKNDIAKEISDNACFDKILNTTSEVCLVIFEPDEATEAVIATEITQLTKEKEVMAIGIFLISSYNEEYSLYQSGLSPWIDKLKKYFDSIILINNNKSFIAGEGAISANAPQINSVVVNIVNGIVNLASVKYFNSDDFKTVLCDSGTAFIGFSISSSVFTAKDAIKSALLSPLLINNKVQNAKNVMIAITFGTTEATVDEIDEINSYIQSETSCSTNMLMGVDEDLSLGESTMISIMITGFDVLEK